MTVHLQFVKFTADIARKHRMHCVCTHIMYALTPISLARDFKTSIDLSGW